MPWTGTRNTIFLIGITIGLAGAGTVRAQTQGQPDASFVVAQNNQQDSQEEQRKRRERNHREREEHKGQQPEQHNVQPPHFDQKVQQQQQQQFDRKRFDADHDKAKAEREEIERKRHDAQIDKLKADREKLEREKSQREEVERKRRDAQVDKLKADRDKLERERAEREHREQIEKLRDHKDAERDRLRDFKEKAKNQAEDRRDRIEQHIEDRTISREEREKRREERSKFSREHLKDIARERHEHREEGGRIVIDEPDSRRIIRDKGRVIIQHNELERLRGAAKDVHVEHGPGGGNRTVITRPNGIQIITVEDHDGRLIRRIKRYPNGREIVLINNDYRRRDHDRDYDRRGGFGFYITLPTFVPHVPERDYYIYADRADEYEMERILSAPPLEDLDEDYTLDEIRYSPDIRKRFRKLNLNSVTFEFGSWEVREGEIEKLAPVAQAIKHIVDRNPDEVFLIAGYTDAVGSDEDNLSLSDRRAESVARVLTDEYGVPPENLVTQGYGEQDLLIDTQGPEERNRRVELMRITNYLAQKD